MEFHACRSVAAESAPELARNVPLKRWTKAGRGTREPALRQNGQSWTCRRAPIIEGHYSNAGWLSSGLRVEYRPVTATSDPKNPPQVIDVLGAELGQLGLGLLGARRERAPSPSRRGRDHGVRCLGFGRHGVYLVTRSWPPLGRIFSTSVCGRGMTCTDTSSPTRRAAAAPASVAAFTAPTSPRTITVT